MVGSASTLMNSPPAWSCRASAALVLAICIRLSVLSCIRAPPEQLTSTNGRPRSVASSTLRVTVSPTTLPIEPIMNPRSSEHSTAWRPFTKPTPATTASARPVRRCSSASRRA
ncbi:MAG: hypothetical protein KatS3mg103_0735 [Phycisphaerales bacterium]|nr:MAG: hypothetical protein KatS3mg103_0735 [Phycisphaerales bacterium]